MKTANSDTPFKTLCATNFVAAPVVTVPVIKPKASGFMYIVLDSAYPDHFKIGRTIDMGKRLASYNSDKPYPSASLHAITSEFLDIVDVEFKILKHMYDNTSPTTFKKEWFSIEHLDDALELLIEAESYFPFRK